MAYNSVMTLDEAKSVMGEFALPKDEKFITAMKSSCETLPKKYIVFTDKQLIEYSEESSMSSEKRLTYRNISYSVFYQVEMGKENSCSITCMYRPGYGGKLNHWIALFDCEILELDENGYYKKNEDMIIVNAVRSAYAAIRDAIV